MNVEVHVALVEGPLDEARRVAASSAGAVVRFEGVVRPLEEGRELAALEYEAYEPMTRRELESLARETAFRHGLESIRVEHSTGRVPVGAISFRLEVASPHRVEALQATSEFIDRLKRHVPLWKIPEWAGPQTATAEEAETIGDG